jgi:hypothetical protein
MMTVLVVIPTGESSRYRPPPSGRRCGLSVGLASLMAICGQHWGQLVAAVGQLPPLLPPVVPELQYPSSDSIGHKKGQNP